MNIMIEFDDFTGKSWLPLLIVWIRSKCWYLVTIHDGRCITTSLPKFGEKSWSPSQVFSNWSPNGRMTLNGFFKLPHPDDIGQIGETWWNLALATQFGHPVWPPRFRWWNRTVVGQRWWARLRNSMLGSAYQLSHRYNLVDDDRLTSTRERYVYRAA